MLLAASAVRLVADTVRLTELDLRHLHVAGWSEPRINRSLQGRPIAIGGRAYDEWLGTRATTTLWHSMGRSSAFPPRSAWTLPHSPARRCDFR